MASIDLIRASNGSGDAVKATVTNARVISSTTIQVDATTNWPSKFIATVGSVDGTGAFVPATVTVFDGILSGGNIEITSFAPGYTDIGNTPGQIVVLKPTTAWANEVADTLAVAHSDNGSLKTNSVTTTAITDGAVVAGKIDFSTLMKIYGSNAPSNVKFEFGWGFIQGNGSQNVSKSVSFSTSFSSAPFVLITANGYKSGSDPSNANDNSGAANTGFAALSITSSGFTAAYDDATKPASSLRILFRFIAIGG